MTLQLRMLQTCMSDIAWFHARLHQICIIGDIADEKKKKKKYMNI